RRDWSCGRRRRARTRWRRARTRWRRARQPADTAARTGLVTAARASRPARAATGHCAGAAPSTAAPARQTAARKLNRDEVLGVARKLLNERKLDHLPFVRYTNRKRSQRRPNRPTKPAGRDNP